MQALTVINLLEELPDSAASVFQISILGSVDLLLFQRLHESLCTCIVVRVTAPAHADLNLALQDGRVIARSILHASIGVMD